MKHPFSHVFVFSVGGSIAGAKGDEDISPYATFHLLGMREENKGAAGGGGGGPNFQTMPPQQHQQMQQQQMQQMQQQGAAGGGPISPRHSAQTMNVSCGHRNSSPKFLKPSIFFKNAAWITSSGVCLSEDAEDLC